MPYYMYVTLQGDDKISVLAMEAETGRLSPKAEVPVIGGPNPLAISPDRKVLYVGRRGINEISSFRIDQQTGGLTQSGTVSLEADPCFLSTDRKGRYLLSAYYRGAHVAVHPLRGDGAVGDRPIEWLAMETGAHAIQTDPSNRFAFVPHIARVGDNVLEPLRESYGPNAIFQLRFDENTGRLTPTLLYESNRRNALGHATTVFIQPRTSFTFPMSRAVV